MSEELCAEGWPSAHAFAGPWDIFVCDSQKEMASASGPHLGDVFFFVVLFIYLFRD